MILANSVILAIEDPSIYDPHPIFKQIDDVFLALYSVEMVLKILGMGFFLNQGSYLRDAWNCLDFLIVLSGYLSLITAGGGVKLGVLRSFRVLRPLKTITGVKGLRIIVSALISSLVLLKDTIIILLFFFLIFALAGL